MYLHADVDHAVRFLFARECLRNDENGKVMVDLAGVALLPEADSNTLFTRGSERLPLYVGGQENADGSVGLARGFLTEAAPAFPKHIGISTEERILATENPDMDTYVLEPDEPANVAPARVLRRFRGAYRQEGASRIDGVHRTWVHFY